MTDHLARAKNVLASAENLADNQEMLLARGIAAGVLQDRCAALGTAHALVDIAMSLRELAGYSLAPEPEAGADYIDVLFDGPPGPVGGRFVEVEDHTGRGIRAGEWLQGSDLLWALRIHKGGV